VISLQTRAERLLQRKHKDFCKDNPNECARHMQSLNMATLKKITWIGLTSLTSNQKDQVFTSSLQVRLNQIVSHCHFSRIDLHRKNYSSLLLVWPSDVVETVTSETKTWLKFRVETETLSYKPRRRPGCLRPRPHISMMVIKANSLNNTATK